MFLILLKKKEKKELS